MNLFYGVIKSYLDEFFVGIVHDIIFLFFKTITAVKNNIMYTQWSAWLSKGGGEKTRIHPQPDHL